MYRKDGIANLDIIILVAKDTVLLGLLCLCVCVCMRTCICVRTCIRVSEIDLNIPRDQNTHIEVIQSFIINSNIITDCQ